MLLQFISCSLLVISGDTTGIFPIAQATNRNVHRLDRKLHSLPFGESANARMNRLQAFNKDLQLQIDIEQINKQKRQDSNGYSTDESSMYDLQMTLCQLPR